MKYRYLFHFILFISIIADAQDLRLGWVKSVGGGLDDIGQLITNDATGNVYVIGTFNGTVDFDPGPGIANLTSNSMSGDKFILKSDASGNFIWVRSIGAINGEIYTRGLNIFSGFIYLSGGYYGTVDFDPGPGVSNITSNGFTDLFILKLDTAGNFAWAKTVGGIYNDFCTAISSDALGNIYATGTFEAMADFDPGAGVFNITSAGNSDMFILKLDGSGNFIWVNRIGGGDKDISYNVNVDKTGTIYTTGIFRESVDFNPGPGTYYLTAIKGDAFVSKYDSSGNFIWAKSLGGNEFDYGYNIAVDITGNVYTQGLFTGTADFNPDTSIFNLYATGYMDLFISKLDSTGKFVWARNFGGVSGEVCCAMTIDIAGNVYSGGYFSGDAWFDSNSGKPMTSKGMDDMYLLKLSSNGNVIWAENMGGMYEDILNAICITTTGIIYTTGSFNDTADLDPTYKINNFTSSGGSDIYFNKIIQVGNGITIFSNPDKVKLYPNPNTGNFIFESENSGEYMLMNELGQCIRSFVLENKNNFKIECIDLTPGIYYIKKKEEYISNGRKIIVIR